MSVYGEGLGRDADGTRCSPRSAPATSCGAADWEPARAHGEPLTPDPTPETKTPALSSIYALNKFDQERMCLLFGRAYDMPTVALRFFNVYGTRQALSNPYTGVLAIFASRLLNGSPPLIFEDGRQRRDFVHVRDVARACRPRWSAPGAAGRAINVGSGVSRTVEEVARALARAVGREDLHPQVTGKSRSGDIRHCFADTSLARDLLGFQAEEEFETGLRELAEWWVGRIATDRVEDAMTELEQRGLVA